MGWSGSGTSRTTSAITFVWAIDTDPVRAASAATGSNTAPLTARRVPNIATAAVRARAWDKVEAVNWASKLALSR